MIDQVKTNSKEQSKASPATGTDMAKMLARRLIHRRDVKAVQRSSGAYRPVERPWRTQDIVNHLRGIVSYGHYVVAEDGTCRVLAFDIDFEKSIPWDDGEINPRDVFGTDHPAREYLNAEIRALADGIAWKTKNMFPELVVSTSFSGSKGIHVYGSFTGPTTAETARMMAQQVLESFGVFELHKGKNFWKHVREFQGLTIETFPKQERVNVGGFGNLLRLPCGVHQKTKRRGFFYDQEAPLDQIRPDPDQFAALRDGSLRRGCTR